MHLRSGMRFLPTGFSILQRSILTLFSIDFSRETIFIINKTKEDFSLVTRPCIIREKRLLKVLKNKAVYRFPQLQTLTSSLSL